VFLAKDLTLMRCLHFPDSRFDIVNRSSFWCKLLQYLTDLFSDFSGCLILAFTVERCIAAYMPTQFKRVSAALHGAVCDLSTLRYIVIGNCLVQSFLCVCVSVREHISGTTRPIFTGFFFANFNCIRPWFR